MAFYWHSHSYQWSSDPLFWQMLSSCIRFHRFWTRLFLLLPCQGFLGITSISQINSKSYSSLDFIRNSNLARLRRCKWKSMSHKTLGNKRRLQRPHVFWTLLRRTPCCRFRLGLKLMIKCWVYYAILWRAHESRVGSKPCCQRLQVTWLPFLLGFRIGTRYRPQRMLEQDEFILESWLHKWP